jgi:hypothetical protein
MLCSAASVVLNGEYAVIVGRDDSHAALLKARFEKMCTSDPIPFMKGIVHQDQLSAFLTQALGRSTFLTIHSLTHGYRDAWVYVDHWAQEALVERWWTRGGT